ncbi:MAG TPA: imidazole glycerol phosphate synthase subunit HisF [Planctomycetes bacterium]|nr:imidazole glycerol phosphate synthase subunit HisF [Planctomycetota bacterium]
MALRIIPRLDIKGPNLVKGIHLEGLRVLGKPEFFARQYCDSGADELFYMDAVASLYERNSLVEIIQRTARDIAIPLTVGGGLRSVDDMRDVLRAGADKIAINTAAIRHPELIREASRRLGSSTIVVCIEAIRQPDGTYEAYTDCGRESTGVDVFQWAEQVAELGAGEIVITSVDREGTGRGYDIELTRRIADSVSIPVISHGGAGCIDDVHQVVEDGHADAVCLASCLHYELIGEHQHSLDDFAAEGNIEFLSRMTGFSKVQGFTLAQLKTHITGKGIDCRWN